MSYCRFSEGDVYFIADHSGGFTCYLCRLNDGNILRMKNASNDDAIIHLQAHRNAGHAVPDRAFVALRSEIDE